MRGRIIVPLPNRPLPPACTNRGRSAELVDLTALHVVNRGGIPKAARKIAALPAGRDVAAGVAQIVRDFEKLARKRHRISSSALTGAALAVECLLWREIKKIRQVGYADHS